MCQGSRRDLLISKPVPVKKANRPRILYFSPYWPHRDTCASELRALHVARALRDIGDVDVVVVGGEEKEEEWLTRGEHEFRVACTVAVSPRPNKSFGKKVGWMLDPRTLYPHGCGADREAMERVLRIAQDYDLVWFCKLRTPNMFPCWAWPRSVADIDDVPSTFEQSVWQAETRITKRVAAARRFYSERRRDKLLGERFTVLTVCSENDKRYLQALGVKVPLHVIPNGFEPPNMTLSHNHVGPARLGFIGIFDYPPNLEGVRWFVTNCWRRIKTAVPEARLRLVGRYSDGPLKPSGLDVDGLGFVEDAAEEIATWSAMVVPTQVGAGTRGKIAQAFSLKCPVVATSLGAYGYESTNGRLMYLADSPEDFADACIKVIQQPTEAAAMAEKAWEQFLKKWSWDAIRPSVWAAAEDCLLRSSRDVRSNQVAVN
jgi:glycosyltransferase involved in cell wall biosynthesis